MFLIYCNNKSCGRDQEALLDTETNEVECAECGRAIAGITSFTKIQMKTIGQIKRAGSSKQAFATKCPTCRKESAPKVMGSKVGCGLCSAELTHLSPAFVQMLKTTQGSGKI